MSGRVDDAITVLRDEKLVPSESRPWSRAFYLDAVDVLAGELERLRGGFPRGSTDVAFCTQEKRCLELRAAIAERDVLAVQVEQLREALRQIEHYSNEGDWVLPIARAALDAGSTTRAVSAGNEQ